MRREDITKILCTLKYCTNDFDTEQTSFLYEFSERKYEIHFKRDKGIVAIAQYHPHSFSFNRSNKSSISPVGSFP